MSEDKVKEVKVTSDKINGSQYSQVVTITTTDIDSTLEFVFINPRSGQGEVVARVTLPNETASSLAKTIENNLDKHYKEKGN